MQKTEATILVIDDDPEIMRSLVLLLSRQFATVLSDQDPGHLYDLLKKKEIGVVLLDMNFKRGIHSGEEGFHWLTTIKKQSPDTEVVMITAYGDLEMAVRTIKEGAHDFILKPWMNEKLLVTVMAAVRQYNSNRLVGKMKLVQGHLMQKRTFDGIMLESRSDVVKKMLGIVRKVAASEANVLITGENGTGKEIIAELTHQSSARRAHPFIRVDLGAISENLFESELFGHVKGAFTDARDDKIGRIEIASDGTLFLDEIANLPLGMQSKLLSVIQGKKLIRVGSSKETLVNFRLICATNRNLQQMVEEGTFREDLLYRINTVEINVPPLRQRAEDIPLLLDCFLETFSNRYNKQSFVCSRELVEALKRYPWPGNIREMKHAVERAVILSDGKELTVEDFGILSHTDVRDTSQATNLKDVEMVHILQVLKKNQGRITQSAQELGISRYTLHRKLKKNET